MLALLTFCAWPTLGGIVHLDGLADFDNPVASVVFTEFIKEAPNVRITNLIPVGVPVPHLVPVDRVKTVEIPQPQPYPVDAPYPVPVNQPVAYPVPQDVPVPVSQPVPYAVPQEVPVPVSKPFPWPVPQPFPLPGDNHQYSSQELVASLQASATTGPSEVTTDIVGSYLPQYQTSTQPQASELPQQTDGTSTNLPSTQSEVESGNSSSGVSYSASTTADAEYVSELVPLLKGYLQILQHQQSTEQTHEPLQSYSLQVPVPNESNTTLENISGEQPQSGTLTFPTLGNYLQYGLQDHAVLSLQSPGISQSALFSSQASPESSVNATVLQQQHIPGSGTSSGQLTATEDSNESPTFALFPGNLQPLQQNDANTLPTSDNYLYNSQFIYPYFPSSGVTNNILSNTQPYPYVQNYGFQSQSTLNAVPGTLGVDNSGSSADNVQQTESGTSTDFQNTIQNPQTYDSVQNIQNYAPQDKINALLRLALLQNIFSHQTSLNSPLPTPESESPKQDPVNSEQPPAAEENTGRIAGEKPETTESPPVVAVTTASSVSSAAPLNVSTSAPPESIQIVNPPPVKDEERLEARSTSDNTLKDPEPLSEPTTTATTTTTTTKTPETTATVTQLEEKSTVTTAEPETTTSPTVKPSPTPLVTTAELPNIPISTQVLPNPAISLDPQYRIFSLPFVQPQLLTLPQQQRQQLQVVVTQI